MSNTNLCDLFCRDIDTFKHLLWECCHSQHFWSQLKTFLAGKNIELTLNYKEICFGKTVILKKDILVNFIIISAKYFIFKNKYTKTEPTFNNFKKYLKYHEQLERLIALSKDKIKEHEHKWSQLQLF